MTPQKLRVANSLMSDIDLCKHQIELHKVSLAELKDTPENERMIRYRKISIAIEQNKQVALEREFKNL